MKNIWIAILAVVLLPAGLPRAGAVTFGPMLSGEPGQNGVQDVPEAGLQPIGAPLYTPSSVNMSLNGAMWDIPNVSVAGITGFAGDRIRFEPQIMPMVSLEYRLSDQWGFGGWYNPLNTDTRFKGPTADLLTSGASPLLNSDLLATLTLNMWDAHVTYHFPQNWALQAGVVDYHGTVNAIVADPRQPGNINLHASVGDTSLHFWGYKSYRVWGYTHKPAFFTAGLGVRRRISSEDDAIGPKTTANASLGYTYYPRPNLSADVTTWFADFNHADTYAFRASAGLTGHF
ncbi:MAG TPA: hypothetical protein VHR86_04830 [Armatimonadota bacterium]|nr:hypothetical protein [Armatimonadota bacterium]